MWPDYDRYEERFMRDIAKWVLTQYTLLAPVQASSYRERLNALLGDAQLHVEYLGGYGTHMGEDGRSLHAVNVHEDKERGSSALRSPDEDDVLQIPPPCSAP